MLQDHSLGQGLSALAVLKTSHTSLRSFIDKHDNFFKRIQNGEDFKEFSIALADVDDEVPGEDGINILTLTMVKIIIR